jgi:hypothetical protein
MNQMASCDFRFSILDRKRPTTARFASTDSKLYRF